MSRRGVRGWMGLIFIVALVARLTALLALRRWDDATPGPFRQLALNLLDFGAYYFREWGYFGPSSAETPPYAILLAGLFAGFGRESPTAYFAAIAINSVLGALCAVATASLVRRIVPQAGVALAAAMIVAVSPAQIYAATFAQPLALTALLLVAACLLWHRSMEDHGIVTWIGVCSAVAFAALLAPAVGAAMAVALILTPFVRRWPVDVRVRNVAILAAAAMLFIWPWVARNHAVHGRWLMTTMHWRSAWAGANDNASGSDRLRIDDARVADARVNTELGDDAVRMPTMQIDTLSPQQRSALHGQSEIVREDLFRSWTCQWVNAHRTRWLELAVVKTAKAWFIDWDHPMSRHPLAMLPRCIIGAAALSGLLLAIRHRVPVAPVLLLLVVSVIACALTVATARQTIVLEPLQVALAFAGLAAGKQGDADDARLAQRLAGVAR